MAGRTLFDMNFRSADSRRLSGRYRQRYHRLQRLVRWHVAEAGLQEPPGGRIVRNDGCDIERCVARRDEGRNVSSVLLAVRERAGGSIFIRSRPKELGAHTAQ